MIKDYFVYFLIIPEMAMLITITVIVALKFADAMIFLFIDIYLIYFVDS